MVRQEGRRPVNLHIDHHCLDAILAQGYGVRSQRGSQFIQNKLHFAVAGKTAAAPRTGMPRAQPLGQRGFRRLCSWPA